MSQLETLPLDPDGTLSSNRLTDSYTIQRVADDRYFQIKLRHGPFHSKSLEEDGAIIHVNSGVKLKLGRDFMLSYRFDYASKLYGEIHTAIVLINKKYTGTIDITAQYLGGPASVIEHDTIPNTITMSPNNLAIPYDSIVDIPTALPVATHMVRANEVYMDEGMSEGLNAIKEALEKLVPEKTVDISNVNGLVELLLFKNDLRSPNAVNVFTRTMFTNENLKSQIQIILPNTVDSTEFVDLEVSITSKYDTFRLYVSGTVSRSGVTKETWTNARVRIEGTNTEHNVYLTYTQYNEPCIYLSESTWGKVFVNINRYFSNSTKPDDKVDNYSVVFPNDNLSGFVKSSVGRDNDHIHDMSNMSGFDAMFKTTTLTDTQHLDVIFEGTGKVYTIPTDTEYREVMLDLGWPERVDGDETAVLRVTSLNDLHTYQEVVLNSVTYHRTVKTSKGIGEQPKWIEHVHQNTHKHKVKKYFEIDLTHLDSTKFHPVMMYSSDEYDRIAGSYVNFDFGTYPDLGNDHQEKFNAIRGELETCGLPHGSLGADVRYYGGGDYINGILIPWKYGDRSTFNYYDNWRGHIFYIRGGVAVRGYTDAEFFEYDIDKLQSFYNSMQVGRKPPLYIDSVDDLERSYGHGDNGGDLLYDNDYHGIVIGPFTTSGYYRDSAMKDFVYHSGGMVFNVDLSVLVGNNYNDCGVSGETTIFPWTGSSAPKGYTKVNGSAFDTSIYTNLAKKFPSGYLPNLDGMVLKGVKGDSAVLAFEGQAILSHSHGGSLSSSVGTMYGTTTTRSDLANGWGEAGAGYFEGLSRWGYEYIGKETRVRGANSSDTDNYYQPRVEPHSHSFSVNMNHSHSVSISSSGGSENIVNNYSVCWIIKLN